MIVCEYIDKNVKNYLKNKPSITIVTLFKEPFCKYRENKVFFVDDILSESDYRKIDEFVKSTVKIVEEVFSHYLDVDEYNLFHYLQLQAKRNLSRVCKYKYAVDKIAKKEKKTNIAFFSSESGLSEWLKQDYIVTRLAYNAPRQGNTQIKSKIKAWMNNSHFVHYIVDQLFEDHRDKPNYMLWLGGRSLKSKLIDELKKEFKIFFLFQNSLIHRLSFAKRGIKCNLLKVKDHGKFNERYYSVEQQYEGGLKKIASLTGLKPKLLEIILEINRNKIKELLVTLCILQENEHNLSLLFVEQSVIGVQALAVDYFNQHGICSVELLHGIPAGVRVGNTTKVAVYGQRDKSFLSDHGVPESKLVITGSPYYDKFFDIKEEEKSFEFFLLILDWILFVPSSRSHQEIFTQVMYMLKLLQHLENERLVIKLHPDQSKKELEYIHHIVSTTGVEKRVEVKRKTNLTELLKKAKIVFTYSSSVGVEALLMKKPLIVLDFFPDRKIEYEKYGGCVAVKNFKELLVSTRQISRNIDEYLKKNSRKIEQTRRYFSGDLTGESYKKVANLCREVVSKCI